MSFDLLKSKLPTALFGTALLGMLGVMVQALNIATDLQTALEERDKALTASQSTFQKEVMVALATQAGDAATRIAVVNGKLDVLDTRSAALEFSVKDMREQTAVIPMLSAELSFLRESVTELRENFRERERERPSTGTAGDTKH